MEYESVCVDMSDPEEYIRRIHGIQSSCITQITFTTNLGKKIEVGDYLGINLE